MTANPRYSQPPLEYLLALDAACTQVYKAKGTQTICNVEPLWPELSQRVLPSLSPEKASNCIWLEPQQETWETQLLELRKQMKSEEKLAIVFTLPFGHLLPGRKQWRDQPLCINFNGLYQLLRAIDRSGFKLQITCGFHSPSAVFLNFVSKVLNRLCLPHFEDRVSHLSRTQYIATGISAYFSTVMLVIVQR